MLMEYLDGADVVVSVFFDLQNIIMCRFVSLCEVLYIDCLPHFALFVCGKRRLLFSTFLMFKNVVSYGQSVED